MDEQIVEQTKKTIISFNEMIQKKIVDGCPADELAHLPSAVHSLAQLINALNGVDYKKRLTRSSQYVS